MSTPPTEGSGLPRPLVLYDGHCALCHGAVTFALARDPKGALRFATLDGVYGDRARTMFPALAGVASVVLIDDGGAHVRSDAALRLAEYLTGPWPHLARVARFVPGVVRDVAYDAVARVRYRIFGRIEACPVRPPALHGRFLD